jgi:LemA protein
MEQGRTFRPWWIAAAVVVGLGIYVGSTYNHLIRLDQGVQAAWAQVETVYQRRSDLIPNLVSTVKGAASFEKGTLESVTAARAKVTQLPTTAATPSKEALAQFQTAQDGLSSALTRFFAVAEAYPNLTATGNFRDLQTQLEGTENRIAVERRNFNEAARTFNTSRQSFPTNLIAGFFGEQFAVKPYFQAVAGASQAPTVSFE